MSHFHRIAHPSAFPKLLFPSFGLEFPSVTTEATHSKNQLSRLFTFSASLSEKASVPHGLASPSDTSDVPAASHWPELAALHVLSR